MGRFLTIRARSGAALACAVLIVLVLAACGGNDGPASYVGTASNAVVYVSWTRSKDTLTGQLTQARAADNVQDGTVSTDRVSFDGTVSGSSVSLRLNQGLGSTSTLTGKLDGDTLALDYPGTDGQVITIKLNKGDSSAFNTPWRPCATRPRRPSRTLTRPPPTSRGARTQRRWPTACAPPSTRSTRRPATPPPTGPTSTRPT